MDKDKIKGLSNEQVEINRSNFGSNKFSEVKQETFFHKFLESFKDPIIGILCVAVIINIVIYVCNLFFHFTEMSIIEVVGIIVAVLLATFVSAKSEYSSEQAFQKLQEEASKIKCKVLRNGSYQEIQIDDIVCEDVVLLQAGDKIPADGYILNGSIKVDQSSLNGESEEVTKEFVTEKLEGNLKDLSDKKLVFRGTIVNSGEAIMKVLSVGDSTIEGQLAQELQETDDRETPLKVKLNKLADGISKFGYAGAVAIAIAFILKNIITLGFGQIFADWVTPVNLLIEAVMLAVIIIVMAVPEGLPLMISLVSSLNMKKMLKDNVLVRKINGIETAGSLNVLLTDKTGTLTTGKMVVDKVFQFCKDGSMNYVNLIYNTEVIKSNGTMIGGNSTDRAIANYLDEVRCEEVTRVYDYTDSERGKLRFNSVNKYSAVELKDSHNIKTYLKGAPEVIISNCKKYLDEDNKVKKMTQKVLDEINEQLNEMASKSMRVIALAYADDCTIGLEDRFQFENEEPIFTGLVGIRDTVRKEVPDAVKEVQNAGVHVIMVTGDNIETATAIARETGIITSENDVVMTSTKFNELPDDVIKEIYPNIKVIARALPSDKSRLVKIGQELNLVVGMTGDGVNDSSALKKADVGFAMGSGTEVAKEAGDIVILDDNFSSIEKAILYGRTIFNNIRKFITMQLTINVAAVLISFLVPLFGLEQPITVVQMIWINLIMDTLSALAMGGLATEKHYMKEKPKSRTESIISPKMASQIALCSLYVTVVGLLMLLTNMVSSIFISSKDLLTGYFTVFVFTCVLNAINIRTEELNIFSNIKRNLKFFGIFGLVLIIQVIMTYFGGDVLRMYGLNSQQWITCLIISLIIIPIDLLRKFLIRNKE